MTAREGLGEGGQGRIGALTVLSPLLMLHTGQTRRNQSRGREAVAQSAKATLVPSTGALWLVIEPWLSSCELNAQVLIHRGHGGHGSIPRNTRTQEVWG